MKTKELIELLLREDPSGELDVVIGNQPVSVVQKLPAYYDGPLEVLEYAEHNRFVLVKGKYVRDTDIYKVNLRPYGIMDALCDHPELEIEYPDCTNVDHYIDKVEKMREEIRQIDKEIDEENNEKT